MSTLSNVAGKVGKAIDVGGNFWNSIALFPNKSDYNLSESLESWGGNPGSSFVLVPPAYASEENNLPPRDNTIYGPPIPENLNQPIITTNSDQGGGGGGGDTGGGGQWLTGEQVRGMGLNPDQYSSSNGQYYVVNGQVQNVSGGGGVSPGSPVSNYEQETRNAINSGYDAYFSQLDQMLNRGLGEQQTAQNAIANSQYQQGLSSLGAQRVTGQNIITSQRGAAETNQAKNLRDIASNLKNSFMAGNVYLGTQGAGDSSAANQYSYALTKMGSRQRSDVMGQTAEIQKEINTREENLNNTYNSALNDLASQKDQKIMEVANWYARAQNDLRQAVAQGRVSQGQDLASLSQTMLSNAMNQLNAVETESANFRSALESWALSNSENINQLKSNLAAITKGGFSLPSAPGAIAGTPQVGNSGNLYVPGYNYNSDDENIWRG
jgi:hypothetical protein